MAQQIRRVVVVGGGIGGLTVANALLRKGIEVKVLERAPSFSPTAGAGFGFSPNGQACLNSIGFTSEQLSRIVHPLTDHVILGPRGNVMAQSDHLKQLQDKYGYCLGGTLRADLVELLAKPLRDADALMYNQHVTSVDIDNTLTPSVTLASRERMEADLIIGADGIHSIVAKAVLGRDHDAPVFNGENIFYGVIDAPPTDGFIGAQNTLLQVFDRGEFITFRVGGEGRQCQVWALTQSADSPAKREEWATAGKYIRTKLEGILTEKYGDENPATRLLEQTRDDRLLYFGLFYRKHKSRWHRGRGVLLGDACHATLPYVGQGANQAIEDGIVLTRALEERGFRDVEKALKSYYDQRDARTKKVVDTAWWLGKIMHVENSWGAMMRDRLLKWLIDSGTFIKEAEKEIIQHCPVPIVPIKHQHPHPQPQPMPSGT